MNASTAAGLNVSVPPPRAPLSPKISVIAAICSAFPMDASFFPRSAQIAAMLRRFPAPSVTSTPYAVLMISRILGSAICL